MSRTSTKKLSSHSSMTPTDILRFLDQIDISLWASTPSQPQDEPAIIDFIVNSLNTDSALTWYQSLGPKKLTLNALRMALLKDFGVENWEAIMARYENANIYYNSQEFKLRLSYLDEIEGLKDQIKFRNKSALEDRKRTNDTERMWEGIVAKKNERIEELETQIREARGPRECFKGKGRAARSEDAFQRFGESIEEARERLRKDLGIREENLTSYPTQPRATKTPPPKLPPLKSVHWPNASSLENIFELPAPSLTPPHHKSFSLRRPPLEPLDNNTMALSQGVPPMKDEVEECDELLDEWDKELVFVPSRSKA